MAKLEPTDVRFFATPAELRDWFDANHATAPELWLGQYKGSSGRPSVTWAQAVDEALCVGWIDGILKRLDETSHVQRFTPRRKRSIWSAIKVANVERLLAEGRMRPSGIAAYEARTPERTAIYTHEREVEPLTDDEVARICADPAAWADWQKRAPSYRRQVTGWITGAKQSSTRERRLTTLIDDSRAARPIKAFTWERTAE
jgi:uncharacterized protein YdeI (YjbR/CyaY-like superfamily)